MVAAPTDETSSGERGNSVPSPPLHAPSCPLRPLDGSSSSSMAAAAASTRRKDLRGPPRGDTDESFLLSNTAIPIIITSSPTDPGIGTAKTVTARRRSTTIRAAHPQNVNVIIDDEDRSAAAGAAANAAARTLPYVSVLCGLTAGVLQAGLFNPFDRALYLSVKNSVPFLRWENFCNPYVGFFQSVGHRALSGGLYYPLERLFCSLLLPDDDGDGVPLSFPPSAPLNQQQHSSSPYLHPALANLLAGSLAGTAMAVITNPFTAVKYKSWGRPVNRGMLVEAADMFHRGGLRPFGNGLVPTVCRDLVFGGTYTFLRLEVPYRLGLRPDQQWGANMAAAALATVVSGPFNLARNVQYATRSHRTADTVAQVWSDLFRQARDQPTVRDALRHLQGRLRVGWGTARVAVGMSFGHFVYDRLMGLYEDSLLVPSRQY